MDAVTLFGMVKVVKRSRIHGWGLFAKEPFDVDDIVVEYMGELVRPCVADLREKKYEVRGGGGRDCSV